MNRNVISIIDGAAGSCGKGKVIGEIATDYNIVATITNNMPNAGHTFVDENGLKHVFRNIPVTIVNQKAELFIGPGSIIDMNDFIVEYESIKDLLGDRKIYVHEMVPIIDDRHKEYEKNNLKFGSTFKGCGTAISEKVTRNPDLEFFKGYKNAIVIKNDDYLEKINKHLNNIQGYVLLEGSQGADLSLNHSGNYPYVTSRNVSTSQLLADSGISPLRLLDTLMVIRPFPIRISNISYNGNYINTGRYGTGNELTWSHINISSLNKSYPTIDMFDDLSFIIDKEYIEFIINKFSQEQLLQVFNGEVDLNNLNNIKLLELERLYNKLQNNVTYSSEFYDFGEIKDLSETTTVTKKERRVFDLDIKKLKNNCIVNDPNYLYLNFFQHLDINYSKVIGRYDDIYFNRYIRNYLEWLEDETNSNIVSLGTGSKNNEKIVRKKLKLF